LKTSIIHPSIPSATEFRQEFTKLDRVEQERWLRLQGLDIPDKTLDDQALDKIIDSFRKMDVALETPSPDLVAEGVAQQALALLPYTPNIIVTLGAFGVLSLRLAPKIHGSPTSSPSRTWLDIVARSLRFSGVHGDIYLRHHRPMESPKIVSVTGAGYGRILLPLN
jgi:hypothetical protein